MRKLILPLVIILIAIFLIGKGFWDSQLTAVSDKKETEVFVVDKGESFSSIAENLKKENLIKSTFIFTTFAKQKGLADKVLGFPPHILLRKF